MSRSKKIDFIGFLKKEFNLTLKNIDIKNTEVVEVEPSQVLEKRYSKKDIGRRLAGTSKLIKTVEVFLSDEKDVDIDEKVLQEWEYEYNRMKINIVKDVEELIKAKKLEIKKEKNRQKGFRVMVQETLEHRPEGNFLNYTVATLSLMMMAMITTIAFPGFTNKSLAVLDSLIAYPYAKLNSTEIIPVKNIVKQNKVKSIKKPSRDDMANYIRQNNINKSRKVEVEELLGQVAGVEESK